LEVKEAYISGKHIGYYFYFKKIKVNESNNINNSNKKYCPETKSPRSRSNLKRPSAKIFRFEDEPKSSREYKKEDEHSNSYNSDFNKAKSPRKKISTVNFDLGNVQSKKRIESAKRLSNLPNSNSGPGKKLL
jgi:hypothetical protein